MTAANTEIVEMFETLEMSPQDISESLGYELESIKAVLLQFSGVYRKSVAEGEEEGFNDEELREAYQIIKDVARFSEVDGVKFKAACRIVDEKKGRLDVVKQAVGAGRVNILVFNQQLLKAREAKARALEIKECRELVLDVA